MIRPLWRSLRPHQWSKNIFVLAPLVFAQRLDERATLQSALLAFVCFCAASSAVYLFNDIVDRDEDRRHPLKRERPLASGKVGVPTAAAVAAVLAVAALAAGASLGAVFVTLLGCYLVLNLLYSLGLKQVVIVDVMIISLGFVLRVLGGGAAIGVEVSAWLLLCTVFLALFLAFSKRRHELLLMPGNAAEQRRVLSHYGPEFLDQMINVVTASTVVCYALYAISPETVERFHTQHLVYTMPLVLFGIFRYLYLVYQRPQQANPTEAILRDRPFLINLALWAGAVVWIVYRA